MVASLATWPIAHCCEQLGLEQERLLEMRVPHPGAGYVRVVQLVDEEVHVRVRVAQALADVLAPVLTHEVTLGTSLVCTFDRYVPAPSPQSCVAPDPVMPRRLW